ncbi:adaptor protein complex AP-2, alpha subunit [Actinidia rufa]|uniref:Adaptor protein complex AP-2, alpha subunit n=1 Tax=Actinidia rufa TaxID=165716 RepID=A0A7J0GPV3_9ERIC|nr:adaptor protein complex AP-2, alpha subunit [Actinidia rufa]
MALSGMRGLSVFISDIRNCPNKEQERLRVDKELGNVRTRFKNEKGLTHYEKKKYVWKILYIYMLGYDVDFGHMEAVSLISAPKYPEKQVGYIVTACLLNENHDFLRLAINAIRNDVIGRNETFQCLALTLVGNIGGREFAESLAPDVQKLLISSSCRPLVRKKAALCLLRLYRKNPDVVIVDGWSDRMAQLLDERDLGVLTSSMSLLVALVANNHNAYWICLPKCVKILERLSRNNDVPQEYTYYGIPSPWLQDRMRGLDIAFWEDGRYFNDRRLPVGEEWWRGRSPSHLVHVEASSLVSRLEVDKVRRLKLTIICKSRDQALGLHLGAYRGLPLVKRLQKSGLPLQVLGEPSLESSFDVPLALASRPHFSFDPVLARALWSPSGACLDVRALWSSSLGSLSNIAKYRGDALGGEPSSEFHIPTILIYVPKTAAPTSGVPVLALDQAQMGASGSGEKLNLIEGEPSASWASDPIVAFGDCPLCSKVKTMRALQYFPTIEDPNTRRSLFEVLQRILMGTDVVKNVNKNNASHAVLFEALALVMHLDAEKEMMSQCVALLGKFIAVREPNIRYLGLENMTRMLMVSDVQDIIKRHQAQIITSLKDPDISIRRRALDLLYGMCDVSNAKDIVEELLQWTKKVPRKRIGSMPLILVFLQYLSTADFAMREELSLKAAILAEKFAPDLSWYVDVILQLIDKAGDFVSDDIWFRVVQIVTNNEDLQPYAAVKAREYLDKPAIHETMVKVSAYILGEYSHLLAKRPGCNPQEIFSIIHEKLPTVSNSTIAILLSTYESCIDAEIQQRAVEYFTLSRKGAASVDIMAEMPKFPERQSALLKKAEDTEADTAEQSAIKLRAQQQTSNALVVTDQHPANGYPPVSQLGLVKVPSISTVDRNSEDQRVTQANGTLSVVDPQPSEPSVDVLGDLLGPLRIDGPPGAAAQSDHNLISGPEGATYVEETLALAPVGDQTNNVQPIGSIAERFQDLCLKDSGVLYEDPYIQIGIKAEWRAHHGRLLLFLGNKNTAPLVSVQALILPPSHLKIELSLVPETIPPRAQVQCPLEIINLGPSRDVAVLDFSYKFGTDVVNVKLRLPAVLNKFLQPISVSAEEFFPQWRSLSGPPLKLQDVVRGVRPMSLAEMANLFTIFPLTVSPGLDPNANNLVVSTTFYSERTRAMLCLVRIETDPLDRTQLRMTVASGDPTLTFELKEFLKEQLVSIPTISQRPATAPPQVQPTTSPTALSDPGAMLAGLLH